MRVADSADTASIGSHWERRGTGGTSILLPRTVVVDDAMIDTFRRQPLVVLSPHFDDACFSLGGFLARVGHGELINIFTQSEHLAQRDLVNPGQRAVTDLRDSEDLAFALRCGLTRHDLGCEEPPLRHRRPGGLRHVEDDIEQMKRSLWARLVKLADFFERGPRPLLFSPLGIGRHVNHRATAAFTLRHLSELGRLYDVCFYEDLPYASNALWRLRALGHVAARVPLVARYVLPCSWMEKASLLELYPSQHRRPPDSNHFRPRAFSPAGPHEAFWAAGAV